MHLVYLDTNIFLYLTNKKSLFYRSCRQFLQYCQENNIFITTSAETVQELIHYTQNIKQLKQGLKAAKESLSLVNQLLVVDRNIIELYLDLMRKYPKFSSRDILHLSAVLMNRIDLIITYDKHFKKFKEIQAMTPTEFLARY